MPCSAVQGAKSQQELAKLVAENLLAFDSKFWLRMATRADAAESREDKERLTALANVRPVALPVQHHCKPYSTLLHVFQPVDIWRSASALCPACPLPFLPHQKQVVLHPLLQ